ncbi:GAF domain-containing SpoIIE family protein phosphatase [Paractinoplanes atraurantiacus]|uniref:GAF domain-containing protein n=1 Tax=Paractinoplanes atraurantiacus TaxID=1036182 RepID=A0A285H0R8_9ACTN|nr:GAF domain-containing SpoIIE family protein phosphatase [Actinoplanes atraurantiacus]SNY29347.1 GAF domain-containing protein [Actinoplanes atraurantiacus]
MLREDLAAGAPNGVIGDPARLRAVSRLGLGGGADPAFDRIAAIVERLIDAPVAVVTVLTADRQHLPGQVGLPAPFAGTREMGLEHSFSRHVVDAGEPLIVADVRDDARMSDNLSIRDLGAVAYAGVPLTDSDGLVLGTLAVMDREARKWTPSEIALLVELGEVCSSELRLRIAREIADEARRHAESAHDQLILLGELTDALAGTMDIDAALTKLGHLVAGRLADWCFIALADPSGSIRHMSAAHHDPAYAELAADLTGRARQSDLKPLLRDVQSAGSIRRDDTGGGLLRAKAPELAAAAAELGSSSLLLVPITAPVTKRVLGLVLLANGAVPFTGAAEQTAAEVGRRAGMAVDNSRLYGHQRHVAEVLQQSMLPDLPIVDRIDLHGRYLPAQAGAEVGGDWYDAFAQPDGSLMLAVGDVSGHDIEAAATMGQVRNLVRGDAYGRDDAPGPLLAQLDRALHGLHVPAAATAVLARLRREGDDYLVSFANAGHPPPLLLRPDGEVEIWWETPEPLLGLLPRDPRTTHLRRVPAGSTLLLYTDGLVEDPAHLIDEGIARLGHVLRGAPTRPAEEICTKLIKTAPRRDDDIALLLARLL